jgi:nitrite reductase/ring-hydroxylating ferredoxin subunit
MNRKEFIKICGWGCFSLGTIPMLLQNCASLKYKYMAGEIIGSDLVVPLESFQVLNGEKISNLTHVVVRNDRLKYPIVLIRNLSGQFRAYLMRCSHQGTELQLFGDRFQCPAHGSEFTDTGQVLRGPAEAALRSFPVISDSENIKISLK